MLSSSSDQKLQKMVDKLPGPVPIRTVNYATAPDWHEEVLRLIDGVGVDLVLENGGPQTLAKSMKCTRRGGMVSQVGYLSNREGWSDLPDLLPTSID